MAHHDNEFGNRIADARIAMYLTQDDLAKRLGVTQYTVCRWENGYTVPSILWAKRIARVLRTTVGKLCGEGE